MIGTPDEYWWALNERQRIIEVFHRDKQIARSIYGTRPGFTHDALFERIIDRHRSRNPPRHVDAAPEQEPDVS